MGVFRKLKKFGYKSFMNIFFFFWGGGGGHHTIGLYLGVIYMHFRVFFLKIKVHIEGYLFGLLKFQMFSFAAFEIPDIVFGVNGRCWARAYV